ncbi:hypothetical protein RMATCC62417_10057 [Rhizopus microsporus]|nr:hypothetical protein RMATCC62417_10057 [Rhizopus microsporus]
MIKTPSGASFPSIPPSDLLPADNVVPRLIHNAILGIKGKQHLLDAQLFRIQRSRHEILKYQVKLHELDKDVPRAWLRHINEDHADASLFIKGNRTLLYEVDVDLKLIKKRLEAVHSIYMNLPGHLYKLNNQVQHEKYKQWMHAYKTLMIWLFSIFGIFIFVPLAFSGGFLNSQ